MTEHITDLDRQELDPLLRCFQVSRMLRLIADIGIADKMPSDGRLTAQVLSTACGVQTDPLLRVLRALAAIGVFKFMEDGTIAHTPRSRLLRTDTPNSLHTRLASGLDQVHGMGHAGCRDDRGYPPRGRLEDRSLHVSARTS